MTEEDLDDIENRLPFVLTRMKSASTTCCTSANRNRMSWTPMFSTLLPNKSSARSVISRADLVDNHDFQVVETYGKTVPDIRKKKGQENLFPKFTTWREQIDVSIGSRPIRERGHAEVFHGRYQDPRDRQVHKLPAFRIEIQDPLRRQGSAEAEPKPGEQAAPEPPSRSRNQVSRFQSFKFQSAEPSGQAVFLLNELSSRSNKPSTWYDSRSSASYAGRSMKPRSSAIASCVSASSKDRVPGLRNV